jgi:predicted DNA-binding antitoxin AbrB/MazE fold protein
MTITLEAIYENGVFKPKQPIALSDGTQVQLVLTTAEESPHPLDEVLGICEAGADFSLAERHDEILYGPLISPRVTSAV